MDRASALLHLHLNTRQDYLAQQRSLGARAHDYQEQFRAARVDRVQARPVESVADVTVDGQPVVWLIPDGWEAVVDARLFTDLRRVRAAALPGLSVEERAVGRWIGGDALSPREVCRLLIAADVVQANAHMTAEVFLLGEATTDAGYVSVWESEDTYFTSRKNVAVYRFGLALEPGGALRVTEPTLP